MFQTKKYNSMGKNNTSMGDLKGYYAPKHEFILFGHKGRRLRNGKRLPDVLQSKRTGNKLHPTQKPISLLQTFIKQSSNENEIILDPFMGSGSTGVACLNTNRRFIGIEIEEKYFNTAVDRLKILIN